MAAGLTFAETYKKDYHTNPSKFIQCRSEEVPCPEALGYIQGKTLGSGTYAKVKAAWSPYESRMIAIKSLIKKAACKDYLAKFLPREIAILQLVSHPNILQVHKIIETSDRCLFMLEIAENGDLLDYINARSHIPETEARYIFKQMTEAIAYCHSIDIAHRDLKCENIMLSRDMEVKIGDFGFAVCTQSPVFTPCGSYSYAAPELFSAGRRGYDGKKADIWSLGVILYAVVCGRLPFGDDSKVKKSANRALAFNRHISADCKNILQGLLTVSPDHRFTVATIFSHNWMTCTARKPAPLRNYPKYTMNNCIPLMAQHQMQHPILQRPEGSRSPQPSQIPIRPYSTTLQASGAGPSRIEPLRTVQVEATIAAHTVPLAGVSIQSSGQQQRGSNPLMARIGAAGRRLADAMRQVSQGSKGQLQGSGLDTTKPKK